MINFFFYKLAIAKRNRKKQYKLDAADVIVLRYPKSGVTWFRMMISRVYAQKLGREIPHLVGNSRFERDAPECPRVFIAMDNIGIGREEMQSRFEGKKTVLLLRDPRDIAVSFYFHLTKRSTPQERLTFGVPDNVKSLSLFEFMMDPKLGLPRIIDFEEFWQSAFEGRPDSLVLHYEDLRKDAGKGLASMMALMGAEVSAEEIAKAVAFSSFENMRQLEARQSFTAGPLQPGNPADFDSFKVRKGKVGGYRDYFSTVELMEIEGLMRARSSRAALSVGQ